MNVAVLGAGSDGRDIASLCARAGHGVSLYAAEATAAMDRIDEIERSIADAAATGEISGETKTAALEGLEATTDLEAAITDSDVIVETTTEATDALQATFADLETIADRETLITTSNELSITAAAAGLRQPDRALGVHFVGLPDPGVVEVLVASQTTAAATERAESFLETLGVTPVRVADAPGVASTRLELAEEVEAMRAVADEILGVEAVDTLAKTGYGHSIGPLERADRAGLDDRLETLRALADALGDRFEPPELLEELVAKGWTGVGAGKGFYTWESGEPAGSPLGTPEIARRDGQPDDPTKP